MVFPMFRHMLTSFVSAGFSGSCAISAPSRLASLVAFYRFALASLQPLLLLRGPFKVLVPVDELQVELEMIDLPASVGADHMEIVTAHKGARIPLRGVR